MNILGIDNVFFQVGPLAEALPFYERLGFRLKFTIPRIKAALLQIGSEEPGLMLCESADPKPSRLWVEVKSALTIQTMLKQGSLLETTTGLTFETKDPWGNIVGFADYTKKKELARIRSDVLIRPMNAEDIPKIVSRYSFPWTTPEQTKKLWNNYYEQQQSGIRTVAIIEKGSELLGYGSLLRKPECPFFATANVPEINAIWIDAEHRRQGLGRALIEWLEELALNEGYNKIGIGVGLYQDYGAAQRLYCQLGYLPEGNGITYKGKQALAGKSYPLDDDLILWFIKTF